jgi:hypothetical protein
MHLLFTLRVLSFFGHWRKVRNVAGREDRSLASSEESEDPRSFHVPAQPIAIESMAGVSRNRRQGEE